MVAHSSHCLLSFTSSQPQCIIKFPRQVGAAVLLCTSYINIEYFVPVMSVGLCTGEQCRSLVHHTRTRENMCVSTVECVRRGGRRLAALLPAEKTVSPYLGTEEAPQQPPRPSAWCSTLTAIRAARRVETVAFSPSRRVSLFIGGLQLVLEACYKLFE